MFLVFVLHSIDNPNFWTKIKDASTIFRFLLISRLLFVGSCFWSKRLSFFFGEIYLFIIYLSQKILLLKGEKLRFSSTTEFFWLHFRRKLSEQLDGQTTDVYRSKADLFGYNLCHRMFLVFAPHSINHQLDTNIPYLTLKVLHEWMFLGFHWLHEENSSDILFDFRINIFSSR